MAICENCGNTVEKLYRTPEGSYVCETCARESGTYIEGQEGPTINSEK